MAVICNLRWGKLQDARFCCCYRTTRQRNIQGHHQINDQQKFTRMSRHAQYDDGVLRLLLTPQNEKHQNGNLWILVMDPCKSVKLDKK